MILGFDIGGTKVLGVATDDNGTIADERRVPTPRDPDALVAALIDLARELCADATAVGVGIAGLVGRDGHVFVSPHLERAEELDLPRRLGNALGVPVVVENDGNVAAWGESRLGAGKGVDDLVLVTLGTGIGAGIVLDGRLVRGTHGFAAEPGHMIVDHNGPRHVTGLPGAWEMFGSGSALGVLARAHGLADSGEELARRAGASDADALAVLDAYTREVAVGVANLVDLLDPAAVVLGGGVSAIGEPLRAGVERHLPALLIGARYRTRLRVVLATLGERAGAIGAALLAVEAAPTTN